MKTFKNMAAQGDCLIMRVSELPEGLVPVAPDGNFHVIAHSETGHNHVIERDKAEVFKDEKTKEVDLYELFMVVKEETPLTHLRSFDTHEPILLAPGVYKVRRQREYTPEGFRRAAD